MQEVISRTDTDREGVFNSLQPLFAIHNKYMELVKALADQSYAVIEECGGFSNFWTIEKKFLDGSTDLDIPSATRKYLTDHKNLTSWMNDNLRKDHDLYSINLRLFNAAPLFAQKDQSNSDLFREIDPGVIFSKGGEVHQMIDPDEQVMRVTDPSLLGQYYLKEFLLNPQMNISRQGWELIMMEEGKWVRRAIKDIQFDDQHKMLFVLDPNLYDASVPAEYMPNASTDMESNLSSVDPEEEVGCITYETVMQGGRRTANMTIDPALHYTSKIVVNESVVAGSFIVTKTPEFFILPPPKWGY